MDPYRLAVTELMLIRTRANQVARLWPEFFGRYPSLTSLAFAPYDDVRDALRPLGLEWRAERIACFARAAHQLDDWPARLPSLPGGGPYIAASVTVAVEGTGRLPLDVTIARVLSRYGGFAPKPEPRRDRRVLEIADNMGAQTRESFHAWLDLAALICLPKKPRCSECPLLSCRGREATA
jgi:A/G-specific adenine glycosylase